MKSKRGTYFLFLAIILLGLIALGIRNLMKEMDVTERERLPVSYVLSPEIYSLFENKYIPSIKADHIYNSKVRPPISFMKFQAEYELVVYRIDCNSAFAMPRMIKIEEREGADPVGKTYFNIEFNHLFELDYLAGPVKTASKLLLTISGDSLQTPVSSDSLVCYHFRCSEFSIRYDKDDPKDIGFVTLGGTLSARKVTVDLAFLKRQNSVYLILLTPFSRRDTLANILLPSLLATNK